MVRKPKTIPGPSHLSKVLANLRKGPRLELDGELTSLRLTLAQRNDHFGARHFMKEDLPRIRMANPNLDIQVEKAKKTAAEVWRPEIELVYSNSKQVTLDLSHKWSTAITRELMNTVGAPSWQAWKSEAQTKNLPLLPGEEHEVPRSELARRPNVNTKIPGDKMMSLREWKLKHPTPVKVEVKDGEKEKEKEGAKKQVLVDRPTGPRPTSGPGAVLPWDGENAPSDRTV